MTTDAKSQSLWQSGQFRSYLASTAFTGTAFSMQQLLVSWMLVGILLLPADTVGVVQAVIGIPGIFLMLLGGASADRGDPRSLLIKVYAVAWLIPFFLALTVWRDLLNLWSVIRRHRLYAALGTPSSSRFFTRSSPAVRGSTSLSILRMMPSGSM